ncbi:MULTISPECIES: Arc family DNA-binding protein [Pseudomonas]|uniref:Arc family DNA-binding protein n=1 Tax=Pseudomonas TaxID=286 RepID=UPI000F58E23E|nr:MULTISPECIES: Arc family DNA-binding protein [Pseudomonas]AZC83942.1 Alginate biosynthesis transcriptional activator [Pseudomonas chlororaphis subsp. piscium]QQX57530.1 Arc family DNA-binding protein [Pseudomonas chlororaphis subsp. aurantiaca]WJV24507.1 Arc family DNA-binding protein [Pseudomonas chlororaphis]
MSNQPQRQFQEKFVVRLPDGMRDKIARQARSNDRSMNSEIVHRLEYTTELETALERANKIIDKLLSGSSTGTAVMHAGAEA